MMQPYGCVFWFMQPYGCGRSGGRVVEGARLESEYAVKSRIEGSNPSRSASFNPNLTFYPA
jgi:hypothetical protein